MCMQHAAVLTQCGSFLPCCALSKNQTVLLQPVIAVTNSRIQQNVRQQNKLQHP